MNKKTLGIIFVCIAVYFFISVLTLSPPDYSPGRNIFAYNLGTHFPWIIFAIGAYFLLRKKN